MARPHAVSGGAEETETENEGYDSPSAYPFPKTSDPFSIPPSPLRYLPLTPRQVQTYALKPSSSPALDHPLSPRQECCFREVCRPPVHRFTLDNWQATSEVACKFVCSFLALPPPFPPEHEAVGAPKVEWDRFSLLIRLEDVERKLVECTIFLVAQFQVYYHRCWRVVGQQRGEL